MSPFVLAASLLIPGSLFFRPTTTDCLIHPFFWNAARRLDFLQDASDRFEVMCRIPKDPDLLELETNAFCVVGDDWRSRLDKIFPDTLSKFRECNGSSIQDLMRTMRRKVRISSQDFGCDRPAD